jgi:hypothetical protein
MQASDPDLEPAIGAQQRRSALYQSMLDGA